ncbi:MAG: 5-(carboxyamino)imidazole ribonucleotide mutase [Lentisphaerae bacterium GWF2_45_14]|nr:MAG: 5-(carboxyamino)imidazole ribonucleotide mutase [Lentisphaerae bacterium GWF2_45_14]
MPENAKIAVIMGSKSDLSSVKDSFDIFRKFDVPFTARIISAHRSPEEAANFARGAETSGIKVIICAAGMAAHLGGVIAAHTVLPVIGLPMACEPFNGLDALLSTVQMPPGIPVASVTVGKAGAKNAAFFALAILALSEKAIAEKLKEFRKEQLEAIRKADSELQESLKNGSI